MNKGKLVQVIGPVIDVRFENEIFITLWKFTQKAVNWLRKFIHTMETM